MIEQAEFEANIDHYVEAAERGKVFLLMRDGKPVCRLEPAER